MDTLFDILAHRRPHGSDTEEACIAKHLDSLPKMTSDGFGNRILTIGKNPSVMFSCHTDTVHRDDGMQALFIDKTREEVFSGNSNCLGADDGAGIWLMLQMIKAGKRGLYVFHRGEECGGLGSQYIRDSTPELLDGIKYCIAFDRKGYEDVITHQWSGRGCSETFATALSAALGGAYMPDSTGIFTDSDNYTDTIPECTNISVGYFDEHTALERLDYGFLGKLADKLRRISWETLPVERDPSIPSAANDYGWPTYNKGVLLPKDDELQWDTHSD